MDGSESQRVFVQPKGKKLRSLGRQNSYITTKTTQSGKNAGSIQGDSEASTEDNSVDGLLRAWDGVSINDSFRKRGFMNKYDNIDEEVEYMMYYSAKYRKRTIWLCLLGILYFAMQCMDIAPMSLENIMLRLVPAVVVVCLAIATLAVLKNDYIFQKFYIKIHPCLYVMSMTSDLLNRISLRQLSTLSDPISYSLIFLGIVRGDLKTSFVCSVIFMSAYVIRSILQIGVIQSIFVNLPYEICVIMMLFNLRSIDLNERRTYEREKRMKMLHNQIDGERNRSVRLLYHFIPRFFVDFHGDRNINTLSVTKTFKTVVVCAQFQVDLTVIRSTSEELKRMCEILRTLDLAMKRYNLERIKTEGTLAYFLSHQAGDIDESFTKACDFCSLAIRKIKSCVINPEIQTRFGISFDETTFGIIQGSRVTFDACGKGIKKAHESCMRSEWGGTSLDSTTKELTYMTGISQPQQRRQAYANTLDTAKQDIWKATTLMNHESTYTCLF